MAIIRSQIINFETGEVINSGFTARKSQVICRNTGTLAVDSVIPTVIPEMTVAPPPATYLIQFNGQFIVNDTSSFTASAKTELTTLYNALNALSATVTDHAATFGNGETLTAGVYTVNAVTNIAGTLTLNGSATDLFVFRITGAFTTGASSTVVLTGGAVAANVWFVATGAPSTGAGSTMRGNIVANQAAPSLGAGTIMEGRMFAINGAPSIDASTMSTPTGTSNVTVGTILSNFSIFAGIGNVSNAGASTVPLAVGTDAGTVTGFDAATVGRPIYVGGSATIGRIFYGIYVDGVLVPDSLRFATRHLQELNENFPLILQTVVSTTKGQVVDVRTYSTIGEMTIAAAKNLVLNPINPATFL
jgi:hypothetical protein